jgi:hypothetical protein
LLISKVVDRFGDELDGSVTKHEVRSTSVIGLKALRSLPVVVSIAVAGVIINTSLAASVKIDSGCGCNPR